MPSSRLAGSYSSSFNLSFLRNLHIVLHSGSITRHSHEQCKRVLFSLNPLQKLLFADFLMMAIPGWGRPSGGGNGNSLQYSCLENSMDRGGWQATVHGVTESDMSEAT